MLAARRQLPLPTGAARTGIGQVSYNPAKGCVVKGQLVCKIDALGAFGYGYG
jgi:tRNA U34 5-carboxymethylaminomethyl modifying enzyme MnmG/GidA